ncbi:hypothetical protein [Nonomuraea cavernae]|uniref:WD40 repeat domain-containing protein n=1 Tax=Nonomuraea cavernae TaxID=2045107 RepID=A0A917Z4T5_9ACTN|nr:hypothetical protein [Nonomuraea cavernae]MCA2188125.1 hypothetical protein [Nonomuraea cavernae]GGO72866.1 hypothetical protein GCM10012289_41970 [Nonomuraea cavernae]
MTAGAVTLVSGISPDSQATGTRAATGAAPHDDVRTDMGNDPPRSLIAAGRVAMSAYWTGSWQEVGKAEHKVSRGTLNTTVKRLTRTWFVYSPLNDTYEQTQWSWVDVAPGLQKAAVLEGELPSKRLGVLDLSTRKVLSWIDLPQGAASATWSPDGKNILATSYDRHPDEIEFVNANTRYGTKGVSPRSGFFIVDATTMTARFNPVPRGDKQAAHPRNDFRWASPNLITGETNDALSFDLDGEARAMPSGHVELSEDKAGRAGLSPNGKLLAGPAGMPTKVIDRASGLEAGTQPVLELLAWADDEHLIALGCEDRCANEFRNALVLVSVDGREVTRLSSYREDGGSDATWHPVLTLR